MHRCLTIALPLALAALACGQVTGLSDDYQFDLVDGSASTDAAGDATKSDAPLGDASPDAKGANACTPQATASALTKMDGNNGTAVCKKCLASACCADVEACPKSSDCGKVFVCKLACTEQGNQRTQCQNGCPTSGAGGTLYLSGIGACGGNSCKAECGFP